MFLLKRKKGFGSEECYCKILIRWGFKQIQCFLPGFFCVINMASSQGLLNFFKRKALRGK